MDVCKQPKPGPVEFVGVTAKTDRVKKATASGVFFSGQEEQKETFFSFVIVDPSTTFLSFLIPWFLASVLGPSRTNAGTTRKGPTCVIILGVTINLMEPCNWIFDTVIFNCRLFYSLSNYHDLQRTEVVYHLYYLSGRDNAPTFPEIRSEI